MLQIRLSTIPSSEGGAAGKPASADSVTVACPDHLVLADLPVAKGLGPATAAAIVKTVGRKSRRHLGERVHFCVRCDFPIAIYGRLSPCEHAFCLDCARSDSICYLCDERIQKIQTIKMMEGGIYICAAPHCLKSFLKKSEFESHIQKTHADLLQTNVAAKNNGNESEPLSAKQPSASESTARAPPKTTPFSPNSTSQQVNNNTNDEKSNVPQVRNHQQQQQQQQTPWPMMQQPMQFPPPYFGQFQNRPSDSQPNYNPALAGFPPSFSPFNYPPADPGAIMGFPQPWNMMPGFPNMMDPQGGSAPQSMPFPPLPPMPPHQFSQPKQEQ